MRSKSFQQQLKLTSKLCTFKKERVAVGHTKVLGEFSQASNKQRNLHVLYDRACFLLFTSGLAILRRETQRLLANVHASSSHHITSPIQLFVQHDPSGFTCASRS